MAPNLILKAGFVRGDYVSDEGVLMCRTDYILRCIFSHLLDKCYFKSMSSLENSFNFKPMSALNSKEERARMLYEDVIEEFRNTYGSPIQEMATKMKHVSVDLLPELMQTVSAELFSEGVTWSRMIGFFVFVGELTVQHIPNDKSGDVINKVYEIFSRHVKETLMSWVDDHGGWEGVESLTLKNGLTPKIDTTTSSDQGWYKNVATSAFRVVGTLFKLAAPHVQSYA